MIWGKRARLHVVGGEKLSWQVESISGSLDGKDESEAGYRGLGAVQNDMNNVQHSQLLASLSNRLQQKDRLHVGFCGDINPETLLPRTVLAFNQCSTRLSDDTSSTFCVERRKLAQDAHKAATKWCCSGAAFWSSGKGQIDDRFMSEESQYPIDVGAASVLLLFCVFSLVWSLRRGALRTRLNCLLLWALEDTTR